MHRPSRAEQIIVYSLLVIAAIAFIAPLYYLFVAAFKPQSEIFHTPPAMAPIPPHVGNFKDAFQTTNLVRAFFNTSLIAALQVTITLLLCSLAGSAFARYRNAPGHRWLFIFVLGTMLIPGAVTTIPNFIVMTNLHLVNTYWAMVLPGAASAFGIFWMRQYIGANIPTDLYDAARIDGASEFTVYWRIVLPIIKPALGALGVLTLIGSWGNLMWAFIVLRTPNMYTLPILIYLMKGEQRTDYGMIMACGLIATLPLIIAFLFFQRSFISGITAGAVKT